MFERFTDRARKIMALANQQAQQSSHEYIGSEHILLGLLKEGRGVGANVLKNLNIDLHKLQLDLEKQIKSGPEMITMGKLPQTPRAKKVIDYAIQEARNLNHNYVGSEHILLGLIREQEGLAAQVLQAAGITIEKAREEICDLIGAGSQVTEEEARQLSEQQLASQPPTILTLPYALSNLLQLDPRAKSLQSEKDAAVRASDYDRALKARNDLLRLLAEKKDLIGDIIARDVSVAQVLNAALGCLDPQSPTTTATLLLAVIRSDPDLANRLAPLLPQIERALDSPPTSDPES